MANIIKIPHIQSLLPFSKSSNIRTYCTPYNFTYSMNSPEHEWGEWTPQSPAWASVNSGMNRNLVPDSSNPSWSLVDDGSTVRISPTDGSGIIYHYNYYYSRPEYERNITCYLVAKPTSLPMFGDEALLRVSCNIPDSVYHINLFEFPTEGSRNRIGISYVLNDNIAANRYLNIVGSAQDYHIFVFKGISNEIEQSAFTINVDGTSDSFAAPPCFGFVKSFFPYDSSSTTSWDIKLIAFLPVAESDEVIANNVNILRTMYNT